MLKIGAELKPARSSRAQRSPVAKRNWKPMKQEDLFKTQRTLAGPPVHNTCKRMSNVTLDYAQIGISLSVM